MAITNYTLPSITTEAGTFGLTLYAEAGLTVPTIQTIVGISQLEQVGDLEPNTKQIQSLTIDILDDYSVYNEGFWYSVSLQEMYLKIYLNEGSGNTPYFYGLVDRMQSNFNEKYVSGTTFARSGTMTLNSVESILFATTMADLITEVLANKVATGYHLTDTPIQYDIFSYISIKGIFSALLKASGLNAAYTEGDTSWIFEAATADFKYINGAQTYYVNELYIPLSRYGYSDPNWIEAYYGELYNFSRHYGNYYTSAEITVERCIVHLLNSIQFMMELNYDVSGGKHIINLFQRSRTYPDSAHVSLGSLISSDIASGSDLQKSGYSCEHITKGEQVWFSSAIDEVGHIEVVPEYVDIEVSVTTLCRVFNTDEGALSFYYNIAFYGMRAEEDPFTDWFNHPYDGHVNEIQYYNYRTSAYVTPALDGDDLLEEAIAGYLFNRFSAEFRQFTRTYNTLKANNGATNTHTNARPFMRTSFDDGTGAKTYYANRVIKDAVNNQLTVDWIEE